MIHRRRTTSLVVAALLLLVACDSVTTVAPTPTNPGTTAPIQATATTSTPAPNSSPITTLPPTQIGAPVSVRAACDHPYLPLRTGASWSYDLSDGKPPTTVTVGRIQEGANGATAELRIDSPDGTSTASVSCSGAGLVFTDLRTATFLPLGQAGVAAEPGSVSLPPSDQLTDGATWSARYTPGGGAAPVDLQFTVVRRERLDVPGGTFDSIVIDFGAEGADLNGSLWLAEDVGVVRRNLKQERTVTPNMLLEYERP